MPRSPRKAATAAALLALTLAAAVQVPAEAVVPEPPKVATAKGSGGAVTSVDPYATRIGLDVLRAGGNATDAAVATAAALGVTEPYSAGVGGGGFFVHYDAATGAVQTIDGRETAPMGMPEDAFVDPDTGQAYSFNDLVSSGVSVGVPGTLATWQRALDRWGTRNLSASILPAASLAREGFVVDQTFHDQTAANQDRFSQFTSTRGAVPARREPACGRLHVPQPGPGRHLPADRQPGPQGALSRGDCRRHRGHRAGPPTTADHTLPVPPGYMERSDLTGYRALDRAPTHSGYRGYDVFGMRSSSSGGTTVGEALNILERYDLAKMSDQDALHRYLEAGSLAFADRAKYFGDEAFVDVPVSDLLSDTFAAERACLIQRKSAHGQARARRQRAELRRQVLDAQHRTSPQHRHRGTDDHEPDRHRPVGQRRGVHPHHRADRWVRHRRTRTRLPAQQRADRLHHDLPGQPGRPQPARARQAAAQLDVADDRAEGREAVPGARVAGRVDDHHHGPADAVQPDRPGHDHRAGDGGAAVVATQRRPMQAEPAFISAYGALLQAYGHQFASTPEIGAATAIEFGPGGLLTAVAEPTRRGGGSAAVVAPAP